MKSCETYLAFISFDDCLPSMCVSWPVAILFGCHGNSKFEKKNGFFNDYSSKTTNAVGLKLVQILMGKGN